MPLGRLAKGARQRRQRGKQESESVPRPMTVAVGCGLLDNQHAVPLSCRASKMRRDRVQRETGREKLQRERRWIPVSDIRT